MHKKVPGTSLHKSNIAWNKGIEEQLYKSTEAVMGQKTRASKNNCQAETSQKQFLIITFTRISSTKCKCGSQTNYSISHECKKCI